MNETSCDIHDVNKAAADLVALGCAVGATHFHDGITQLQFNSMVSSYANEIIKAVDEGLITAWEGVQSITNEYAELSSKAIFYAQNGIGVVAGAMQVEVGVAVTVGSGGWAAPLGEMFIAHGANNIYEGFGNIYNGPETPSVLGPVRWIYQDAVGGEYQGDMLYGSMDLLLSGIGIIRLIRKPDSVQLFRHDPINYERAYIQTGKAALFFEALVDYITLNSMLSKEKSE
ncbi:DUF4225 domain-containing protein [Pseudomonas sp. NPDC098740]|uniref:DUF4225 domain-containing protein n=1 Tax=Pseudomonas sp. NPDC098740 TaxID=3364486 RepID=UPI003839EE20